MTLCNGPYNTATTKRQCSPADREALEVQRPTWSPTDSGDVRTLVLRLACENPRSGYMRIVGALKGLGLRVSATTVRTWLREAGVGPVGTRRGMTWRKFIRLHRQGVLVVVICQ